MDRACCIALADLFWPANVACPLLVFLLVSAATGDKNDYDFKLLWH
jgi:hypothetical protein